MLDLEFLVHNAGNLILKAYSYLGGKLILLLTLDEDDRDVTLSLKTDVLSFGSFYLEKDDSVFRTCRIEIQELLTALSIENGFYVPSYNFGKLMKETKFNYNLAYGKKSTEIKFIFSLIGYGRLISCLLADLDCINIVSEVNLPCPKIDLQK